MHVRVHIYITSYGYVCTLNQYLLTILMTDQTALGYTVPMNIESAALLIRYEICACIIELNLIYMHYIYSVIHVYACKVTHVQS